MCQTHQRQLFVHPPTPNFSTPISPSVIHGCCLHLHSSLGMKEGKGRDITEMEAVVVSSVRQKLGRLDATARKDEPITIFRIPATIRRRSPQLYEPTVVAIGPYHMDNPDLRAMENHKWRFLRNLLSRRNDAAIDDIVRALTPLEPIARRCYAEEFRLSGPEFVEMLLLDGCFILELLIGFRDDHWEPRLKVGWSLAIDLILVENQIPFFILETLANLLLSSAGAQINNMEIRHLVAKFLLGSQISPYAEMTTNFHHILHLFHECYVPQPIHAMQLVSSSNPLVSVWRFFISFIYARVLMPRPKRTQYLRKNVRVVPSATQLQEAGVKFKPCWTYASFLDITFTGGVMEIPRFEIFNETKAIFLNLIAFEQCKGLDMHFTSYTYFIDGLVDTEQDVAVLERSGVLVSNLSSKVEVASFINLLQECTPFSYDDTYLHELSEEVWRYYLSKWPRWRAKLMRDYFSNPWTVISLIGALLLLGFTMVQTFFAVYAYFHPPP